MSQWEKFYILSKKAGGWEKFYIPSKKAGEKQDHFPSIAQALGSGLGRN